jgi:inorganic phosphate transporter, PiT family
MLTFLLLSSALLVAFSNGANDNFKGFATVWGSDTLSYRHALTFATLATIAGCIASLLLASGLVQSFSGRGIIPNTIVNAPNFMLCVASGAGITVLLATRLGFPISTTHALIGGLVGAGLGHVAIDANGSGVNWSALTKTFFAPLIVSPIIAALLSALVYRLLLKPVRKNTPTSVAVNTPVNDCACVVIPANSAVGNTLSYTQTLPLPSVVVDSFSNCATQDTPIKMSISKTLDRFHLISAMSICFARGVNDTPKLVALLLAAKIFDAPTSTTLVAMVMAIGGLLFSKKVAYTMSKDVTRLGHREGLAANMITAFMVILASKFGLPVSTTHVSVGSIAGIGATTHLLNRKTLTSILLSWVATLPLAASIAFIVMKIS